jgi:hypothetical protein
VSLTGNLVCTAEDDYTLEQKLHCARWYARLSDGTVVISDDDRPGAEPASAWLRLGKYLTGNPGLSIREFWVGFRDSNVHTGIVPENAEGYFFRKSVLGFLNDNVTLGFFLLGHLENGTVHVQRWKVPEMILVEKETRNPFDSQAVSESLIRTKKA